MAKKQKCLNCDSEAEKAGMCIACYTKNYRARGPVSMAARQKNYAKERRKVRAALVRMLDLAESLPCFDAEEVETLTAIINAHIRARLEDKEPARLEVVPKPDVTGK